MNIKHRFFIFTLLVAAVVAAFLIFSKSDSAQNEYGTFESVGVERFLKLSQDPDIRMIDVRTSEEHAQGAIPGTDLNLDVLDENFSDEVRKQIPNHATVAIYCRSGNRSKKAAGILQEMGYNVIELGSGYRGWEKWNEAMN